MTEAVTPYDQRLARALVRPLARTSLQPNHVTCFTAIVALSGAGFLASGEQAMMMWGAILFVFSRFLDHVDGELARQTGRSSKLGYLLDYLAGGVSYAALFAGLGWGLRHQLHDWVFVLGLLGCVSAVLAVYLNMQIDIARGSDDAIGYPAVAVLSLRMVSICSRLWRGSTGWRYFTWRPASALVFT